MESIRPSADLRNHYNEIADGCRKNREVVFITKNGREDTVLMGSAEYRQMKAKLELLQMLAEADADIREGRVVPMEETFAEVRDLLEARRDK